MTGTFLSCSFVFLLLRVLKRNRAATLLGDLSELVVVTGAPYGLSK